MNNLRKISYLWMFFSIIISCQKKEEKNVVNNNLKETGYDLYYGKWLPIYEKDDKYYYCTDAEKFIEIGKNKIFDHTPMEDSNFNIDHMKNFGNQTYLYLDKQEVSYYVLNWIDKERGIISCKLNDYDANLFMLDNKIKFIENKSCQPKSKSCEFNDPANKYKFTLEGGEYSNEKEKKNPISAWIIIKNMKNKRLQEIHFEPNTWSTYGDLPCTDFIIKDYNFDGLEDFAIVWDNGGGSGKLYEYYFQDKNGIFFPTESFPLQHGMLAEDIDLASKTIITQSTVGCCHINLNKYKLNSNGGWETSSEQNEINRN